MRKRIFICLIAFSLLSILGGLYIIISLQKTTTTHGTIVKLHQVEILREQLLIQVKKVQADLSLKGTRFARDIDTLISHVISMGEVIDSCFQCHHADGVKANLDSLHEETEEYKQALSRVFTFRANAKRLKREEDYAFKIGEDLIRNLNEMIGKTNKILTKRTQSAMAQINRSKNILTFFIMVWPLAAIGLAFLFFRRISEPVATLLLATRKLKAGKLDHRISGLKDEFGEVAASFNDMADSLKEQMQKMQRTEQLIVFGEYAAKLAHEIKNPLAGIKVSLEVLAQELTLSEEDRGVLTKISAEIGRIESLLKNLLDYAKPPKPVLMPVEVNKILDRAIHFSRKHKPFGSDGSGEIRVEKNFDPDLPEIMADPMQLQQAFLNLLLNAIDAMPEGGALSLNTRCSRTGDGMEIEITDSGRGIADDLKEQIFKPFYTTKPKGTGLGLAITKQLIDQNGGSIAVEKNRPEGTTFRVTIPSHRGKEVGIDE